MKHIMHITIIRPLFSTSALYRFVTPNLNTKALIWQLNVCSRIDTPANVNTIVAKPDKHM